MATELHPVTGLDPGLKNTDCRGRGWTRNRVWMGAGLTQWAQLLFFSCSTGESCPLSGGTMCLWRPPGPGPVRTWLHPDREGDVCRCLQDAREGGGRWCAEQF